MSRRRHQHYDPAAAEQQPEADLFTRPPALHRDPKPTELAAADKMRPRVGTLRYRIWELVAVCPLTGVTPDEACAVWPDITPYSIRPRFTELEQLGLIVATEQVRPNRRGNDETVYRVVKAP